MMGVGTPSSPRGIREARGDGKQFLTHVVRNKF